MNFCRSIILIFIIILGASIFVDAQACGRSENRLVLKFENGFENPSKVNYDLFYVTPKVESIYLRSMDEIQLFVANFYYGESTESDGWFWHAKADGKLLTVSVEKAETYIGNYKQEEFSSFYEPGEKGYFPEHQDQLNGVFENGSLTFITAEMDETAFLMRVSAEGFKSQYFLSNFLGGCRRDYKDSEIRMKTDN